MNRALWRVPAAAMLVLAGCSHGSGDQTAETTNAGADDVVNTASEATSDTDAAIANAGGDLAGALDSAGSANSAGAANLAGHADDPS